MVYYEDDEEENDDDGRDKLDLDDDNNDDKHDAGNRDASRDNNDAKQEATLPRCAECRTLLRIGDDLMSVEEGVLGTRGLVPLERPLFFCRAKCLHDYFRDEPIEKMPRRIP